MKREKILDEINEINEVGNKINSYYVTYKIAENIKAQKWGKFSEFEDALSDIEKSYECIQGELPIERLIFYGEKLCFVYVRNPLWDCVNDESEDSHVYVVVPYITNDGRFGKVIDENIS